MTTANQVAALKIASVADDGLDDLAEEAEDQAAQSAAGQLDLPELPHTDAHLDELCERLAWWATTRRLWGAPPPRPNMQIGKLVKRTRPLRAEPPDAACYPELAALWIALVAQPATSIDRVVFELHYLHRVGNVKLAAHVVGIGRQHWYTLLRDFRRRIYAGSRDVLTKNLADASRILAAHEARGSQA